jgi:hypothetical protein
MKPVLLKCVIDGVVCGLQSQSDLAGAEALAPLIAPSIGASAAAVAAALTDSSRSALGVRAHLVHARGAGVQWTPDNDRCVAARVLLRRAARWRLSGEVTAVGPRPGDAAERPNA